MADDLRPIAFQDPNRGAVTASRRREAEAVADILNLTSSEIQRDILNEARDEYTDTVEDSLVVATPDPFAVVPDEEVSAPLPADAEIVRQKVNRLQRVINQGSGAQRTKAELQIKRELNQAMVKYPSMRGELTRDYANFINTNVGLDELALIDQVNQQRARNAQEELKLIQDHAINNLSISAHKIGTPEFYYEYAMRDAMWNQKEVNALQLEALSARTDVAASIYRPVFTSNLRGKSETITTLFEDYISEGKIVAELYKKVGAGRGSGDTMRVIEDWRNSLPNIVAEIQAEIGALEFDLDGQIAKFGGTADEPHVVAMTREKERAVAHLNGLVVALERLEDFPSALDVWDTENKIRQSVLREQEYTLDNILVYTETVEPILKHIETLGGEDAIWKDEFGLMVGSTVSDVLARRFVASQSRDGDVSSRDVLNTVGTNIMSNLDKYGISQDMPDDIKGPRIRDWSTSLNPRRVDIHLEAPVANAAYIRELAGYVDNIGSILNGEYTDVNEELLGYLVSEELLDVAGWANDPKSVGALADAISNKYNSDLMRDSLEGLVPTTVAGVFIEPDKILRADIGDIKNGNITYRVQDSLASKAIAQAHAGSVRTPHVVEGLLADLRKQAADLSEAVSTYLKLQAHVEHFRDFSPTASKRGMYEMMYMDEARRIFAIGNIPVLSEAE